MPELPEVETVKNALKKKVINKVILNIKINRKNIIDGDENNFISSLKNRKLLDITRIGKFMIFHFDKSIIMLSHLRMEGKFIYFPNQNETSKYARVIFNFKDGTSLDYDDSRTFGYLSIRKEDNYLKLPPISLLGKEGIEDINIDEIYPIIHKDKRYIKEVLLDQHIISGFGNIYVDETLFASNISPLSKANNLNKTQIKRILQEGKNILLKSIKFNGSTVHSFSWDSGKSGGFQSFLKVYGKKGENCPECNTPFIKIKIGGRGTTYCHKCQKLYTDKYVIGITGPISSGKSTALNYFKNEGFKVISCDEIVNNLYKDNEVINLLNKAFNVSNKNEIRDIVKDNKKALDKLNKIIHPLVKKKVLEFIKNNDGRLAIEVPLLFEAKFDSLMDETLMILSDNNTQFIKNRGKKASSQLSINNNINYYKNRHKATYLIYNNKTLKEFNKKLKEIIN